MIPLIPLVNKLDHIILSSRISPLFVIGIPILLVMYYPCSDKWTPTRYVSFALIIVQGKITHLKRTLLKFNENQLNKKQLPNITYVHPLV